MKMQQRAKLSKHGHGWKAQGRKPSVDGLDLPIPENPKPWLEWPKGATGGGGMLGRRGNGTGARVFWSAPGAL